MVYTAIGYPIGVNMTEAQVTTHLDASVMASKRLEVCVGARVAACATVADGQVDVPNGTIGTVVGFEAIQPYGYVGRGTSVPVVRFCTPRGPRMVAVKRVDMKLQYASRDGAYASRYQIPFVIAWAETVHRCQGLLMDAAVLYLASCFIDGMVYVALSRVSFMEGVHDLSFDRSRVGADRRIATFYGDQREMDCHFVACVDSGRC